MQIRKKTRPDIENPLTIYKNANPNKGWAEISKETGVSVNALVRIACKKKPQLKAQVHTWKKIKDTIGVDLINYIKY